MGRERTRGVDALASAGFQKIDLRREAQRARSFVSHRATPLCLGPCGRDGTGDEARPVSLLNLVCDGCGEAAGNGKAARILSANDVRRSHSQLLVEGDYFRGADERVFLVVGERGEGGSAADELVEAVLEAFRTLRTATGRSLGWDFDSGDPTGDARSVPKPVFQSLAAAMVGTVLYRYDSLPALCRNCGAGMLVCQKGKRREFCTDSCKSVYSRRNRKR